MAILALAAVAISENASQVTSGIIELAAPQTKGGISVESALLERRSVRSFTDEPLTAEEATRLLWAAQGVTDDKGHRTAPSAKASYPLEVYLLAGDVTDLPAGILSLFSSGSQSQRYLKRQHNSHVLQLHTKSG